MTNTSDISEEQADAWLSRYGEVWQAGDADAVTALFSGDAIYHEDPFEPPMQGRDAIRRYWQEGAADAQAEVSFRHAVWAVAGDQCFAHWQAWFTRVRDGSRIRLDGTFRLKFRRGDDGTVLCTSLQEWWHRREAPAPGNA
ncbi:YybH family protein [Lentisalinibacter salinarum]|uniref:YybH family protein n=1 Tax=Lentisalinibacter salinarum TaxID=2992239 RepID=UPI003868197C